MPQNNNQDQRSFLARLIAGGAAGPRGDPFANEKSMFAQPAAANVPVPIPRPDSMAANATSPSSLIQTPAAAAAAAPAPIAANATSPSSLLQSPPGLFSDAATATSPSSLMSRFRPGVTAGMLNGQPAAAASGFNRPGWTLLPNGTYAKIPYSSRGFGGQ
jgi:hypothetical protein